jgi:hypothetical protein
VQKNRGLGHILPRYKDQNQFAVETKPSRNTHGVRQSRIRTMHFDQPSFAGVIVGESNIAIFATKRGQSFGTSDTGNLETSILTDLQ